MDEGHVFIRISLYICATDISGGGAPEDQRKQMKMEAGIECERNSLVVEYTQPLQNSKRSQKKKRTLKVQDTCKVGLLDLLCAGKTCSAQENQEAHATHLK